MPIQGDTLDEANETFKVTLSGAVNATISDSLGVGTITDNDPTPRFFIDDVTVTWPGGAVQHIPNVRVDALTVIEQKK